MSRLIPQWIGNVAVPDTRTTTTQLLFCWAQLLDEVSNIKPLLRNMEQKQTDESFLLQAQEISMHLSGVMADKKLEKKNITSIYIGHPETPVGYFNATAAQVMHNFFDEPDLKFKNPCDCPGEIE